MTDEEDEVQLRWYHWLNPVLWIEALGVLMNMMANWIARRLDTFINQLDYRLVGGVMIGYVYAGLTGLPNNQQTIIVFVMTILMAVFWDG